VKEAEVTKKKLKRTDEVYNENLFELLRAKRKQIADSHSIPPFVIFSDASLIQMAKDFPMDENSFLKISGVGMNKLDRYGKVFIPIIKNFVEKNNIGNQSADKSSGKRRTRLDKPRHIIVGESYNDGKSIKELEEEFNVKTQTIINHLVRFTNEGNKVRVDELLERAAIDKPKQKKVFTEFDENGTLSLKTVFEKFNGEISYNDLQILRLIYLNNHKK